MKKQYTLCLALICVALTSSLAIAEEEQERKTGRPNIVLIFIDDMGWADFSCFGNQDARTPHIDRLAAEGIAFEQFYVNSPICSPSRLAISTGQYPQRWKITSYLANRQQNRARGMAHWLNPQAPMLARRLQRAGYATGHFGKWHLGGQRDVADAPLITEYGFDTSLTNFEGLGPRLLGLTYKPGQPEPGRWHLGSAGLGKGPITWMDRSKITAGFTDAALKFIKTAESQHEPFYINLWPDDVHSPFFPPLDKWGPGKRALYLAVLVEMDRQFGRLFDHVRSSDNLRENTLILVCSDNGHEPGAGAAGPLRGCKTNLYEGGIRSSLVAWGPGFIDQQKQGSRNKRSVFAAIDLVPSLLRLSGAGAPAGTKFDGQELLDTLLGRSDASRQAPLFFRRPPDRKDFYGFKNLPDLAVRDGKWKLLCDYDGGRPELYDIFADAGEAHNLADNHPEVVKQLTAQAIAWHHAMPPDAGASRLSENDAKQVDGLSQPGRRR